MDDEDPFSLENVRRFGMPPTKWAGIGASAEAEAEAGLPPGFLERKRAGASHKFGLVHAGRNWCDDPNCPYGCPEGRQRERAERQRKVRSPEYFQGMRDQLALRAVPRRERGLFQRLFYAVASLTVIAYAAWCAAVAIMLLRAVAGA